MKCALLVLTLVAYVAARSGPVVKCPRPPKGENVKVTVTGKGANQWAKYVCKRGFVVAGGHKQLDCKNGQYTSTDALRCKREPRCPRPPKGENVKVTVTGKGANQWAKYVCRRGFVVAGGRKQLDCKDGQYTSTDALRCKREPKCPRPPKGKNVKVTVTGKGANQWAKYVCRRGFVVDGGRKQLDCKDGRYTSTDALRCKREPKCPRPPKGENVKVTVTGKGANQWAKYVCRRGFVVAGGRKQLDCKDGQYTSTDALRCKREPKCPRPPKGENVKVTVTGKGANQWAKYVCRRGFVVAGGRKQLDCKDGRYTSTDALRCKREPKCPRPPKGENVKVRVTGKGANQWAKYVCKRGFVVAGGHKQLDCKNGRYTSTDALRCKKKH